MNEKMQSKKNCQPKQRIGKVAVTFNLFDENDTENPDVVVHNPYQKPKEGGKNRGDYWNIFNYMMELSSGANHLPFTRDQLKEYCENTLGMSLQKTMVYLSVILSPREVGRELRGGDPRGFSQAQGWGYFIYPYKEPVMKDGKVVKNQNNVVRKEWKYKLFARNPILDHFVKPKTEESKQFKTAMVNIVPPGFISGESESETIGNEMDVTYHEPIRHIPIHHETIHKEPVRHETIDTRAEVVSSSHIEHEHLSNDLKGAIVQTEDALVSIHKLYKSNKMDVEEVKNHLSKIIGGLEASISISKSFHDFFKGQTEMLGKIKNTSKVKKDEEEMEYVPAS